MQVGCMGRELVPSILREAQDNYQAVTADESKKTAALGLPSLRLLLPLSSQQLPLSGCAGGQ